MSPDELKKDEVFLTPAQENTFNRLHMAIGEGNEEKIAEAAKAIIDFEDTPDSDGYVESIINKKSVEIYGQKAERCNRRCQERRC
jgi:leucyl aminopeptidase (aminopeptidase T)